MRAGPKYGMYRTELNRQIPLKVGSSRFRVSLSQQARGKFGLA